MPVWKRAWVPEMLLYIPPDEPKLEHRLAEIRARPVSSAMTRKVVTVGPDDEVDRVAALLVEHRIKRAPVLDRGKLVGIVSRLDLVRSLLPPGGRR